MKFAARNHAVTRVAVLVVSLAMCGALGACGSHAPAAAPQDHNRPDARICDAFIAKHGGHFQASGAIDVSGDQSRRRALGPETQRTLRTLRSFRRGALCAVFTPGSDLKAEPGCKDHVGEFLVAADATRFLPWPCFYG